MTTKLQHWVIPLNQAISTANLQWLSPAETTRMQSFATKTLQQQYAITHIMKRKYLAGALNMKPEELEFAVNQYGKPHMVNAPEPVQFNLSHSHDMAVLVLSSAPVGVDVEYIKRKVEVGSIAKRFFAAAECAWLEQQVDQRLAFIQLWTRKEAVVKALGKGIGYGLAEFSVIADGRPVQKLELEGATWQLEPILIHDSKDYVASLCSG